MTDYDISCRRLTDLSTVYLDGGMASDTRTTFEEHLVVCDYCTVHLEQVRITRDVLHSLAEPAADAELLAALVSTDG